ncbi:MAG: rod-binding protein [Desulfobulbaceae bacterium]|nr:rod-binding protein [Desulfobulbaceae bacterium]
MNPTSSIPIDLKQSGLSADKAKEKKLKNACADFEAIILRQMLSTMRKSVPKTGLFHGGYAEDLYQSMHDEMLTEKLAHGKGMGLGEALYQQLSGNIRKQAGK